MKLFFTCECIYDYFSILPSNAIKIAWVSFKRSHFFWVTCKLRPNNVKAWTQLWIIYEIRKRIKVAMLYLKINILIWATQFFCCGSRLYFKNLCRIDEMLDLCGLLSLSFIGIIIIAHTVLRCFSWLNTCILLQHIWMQLMSLLKWITMKCK